VTVVADTVMGRERELNALEVFLGEPAGVPRAALIVGEAGIGKTTAWRYGVAVAAARGYRVLSCSPAEAEAELAYAAVGDLLQEVLPEAARELPAPQRRALRVALLLDDAGGPPPEPRAIAVALLSALRVLSSSSPVLIAIDDVQWLDPSSAAALAFAARRLRAEPVALLLSRRPLGDPLNLPEERIRRIELGPLSLGALRRLLEDRLGRAYSRTMLRRLQEVSGGNPFYALELARVLDPDRELWAGEPLPLPEHLADLLDARLRALPADTVETVQAAAALAHPTLELLEAATGGAATSRLRPAVEAGVVELERGHVRFAHPLFVESVRSALDPREARVLHRRLAAVVPDLEQRARHLALGAEGPDVAVVATLEQAAAAASGRGAPAAAADLAEEALRLTPTGDERLARRTLAAADYHDAAGETRKARHLLEILVAREHAGHGRAAVLERLARIVDEPATSIPLLEQARDEAGDDLALKTMIEQGLAGQAGVLWRDLPGAAAHLRQALRLAEELGDPSVLAQVLAAFVYSETFLGRGLDRDAMERALAVSQGVDDIPLWNHPRWTKASVLDFVDEISESRALLEELCEEARARGDERSLAMFLHESSWIAWRAGDWTVALRQAEDADELAHWAEFETLRAYTLARRTWAYAHLGRVEEAQAAAAEGLALADRIEALLPGYDMRHALGVLALSLGDAQEAQRQLDPLVEVIWHAGIREPGFMRSLPDEVESLIALGKMEGATELLKPFEREARRLDRAWALATAARCRGLLAAAGGDFGGAERAFQESLQQHDRLGEPFEHARTLLAYGTVQRRAKKRRQARTLLEQALADFQALGAQLWAERARAELARVGGRRPAGDELTPTEHRLAQLVAEGRSNKEIATALFVTPKTVATKLSRIYAKLDVHSRTELVRHLSDRAESKV
jgi:DNA-binding CsgD family transcriptional regulator